MSKNKKNNPSDPRLPAQQNQPQNDPDAAAAAAPKPTQEPKTKVVRPRRWRKRVIWTLVMLLIVMGVLRVALNFLLPSVLRRVAGYYGMDASYERVELKMLDGDFGIWHLTLRPRNGPGRLLHAEYCRGNISTMALLRGRLYVWRAEADGVSTEIERSADGHIALLDQFLRSSGSPAAAQPAAIGVTPSRVDLDPPLRIDALRLDHIDTHLVDKFVTPAVDSRILTNLRLSDLGSPVRPTRFELDVFADGLLDALQITGVRNQDPHKFSADLAIVLRGLHLAPLVGYLAPLGIHPSAEQLTMRMRGHAELAPIVEPAGSDAFCGKFDLHDVLLAVDGASAVTLGKLALDIASISPSAASLRNLEITGVAVNALRVNSGLQFAGLEMGAAPSRPTSPSLAVPAATPSPAFHVTLAGLAIRDVNLALEDRTLAPAIPLVLHVDEFHAGGAALEQGRTDASLDVDATLHIPGVARELRLAGSLSPFTADKTLDMAVSAAGIRPDRLRPYLDALGLASTFEDGTFACRLHSTLRLESGGRIHADVDLGGLSLTDEGELGPRQILQLDAVKIGDLEIDVAANDVRVASVELSGPSLTAERAKDGSLSGLGFRNRSAAVLVPGAGPVPAGTASVAFPSGDVTAGSFNLPRLQIDHLLWKDVRLKVRDAMANPPASLALNDAGIEITGLVVDLQSPQASPPGKIRAWLSAPDVAGKLLMEGTILPRPHELSVDVKVSGDQLNGALAGIYLKPLGIEPRFRNASITLHAKGAIANGPAGLTAALALDGLSYIEGGVEMASVASLTAEGLKLKSHEVSLATIQITRPHISVWRQADGSLVVADVKLPSPATQPAARVSAAPLLDAEAAVGATGPATGPGGPRPTVPAPGPMVATLGSLRIVDAAVAWADHAVTGDPQTTATVSVDLDNLTMGRDAPEATLKVVAKAQGSLEEMVINGKVRTSPDAQGAVLDVSAKGIKAGALAAYLPPGVKVNLTDGRFDAHVDTLISRNKEGGLGARLAVDKLAFRDGQDGANLLGFEALRCNASRIDPDGGVIALDEVSVAGLETAAQLDRGGILRLLGLSLGGVPAPAAAVPAVLQAPPPPAAVIGADALSHQADSHMVASPDVASLVAQAHKTRPLITLAKLSLAVKRATFTDKSRPGVAPVVVSDVLLRNLDRLEMFGPQPAARPPLRLELSGKVNPLLETFKVTATAAPMAQQPTLSVDLAAGGIHGGALTKLAPELANLLDGAAIKDGAFQAHLETQITLDRRGGQDLDFSRPFDVDTMEIKDVQFRQAADGPVTAGLESLRLEGAHVRPAEGGVVVKSLEITKPLGRIIRESEGLKALGVLVHVGGATAPAAPEPTATPASGDQAAQPHQPAVAAASPQPAAKPAAEIRIDRLGVDGLDITLEDRTVEPPLLVPLTGLDVDVRGLSNWLPFEEKSLRYSIVVNSGKVPLPRKEHSSAKPPATEPSSAEAGGASVPATRPYEDRELFAQVTSSGKIALYPALTGWTKTCVNGFELTGLASEAKALAGVTIGEGAFDGTIDTRFPGDGSLDLHARLTATDLRLKEPADGPIQRNLVLPMAVDAAIGMLEDADGSITLPIGVKYRKGNVEGVGSAVVGAVSSVVLTAIASTPLKAVEGAGALLGLGGDKNAAPEQPVELTFLAGAGGLESGQKALLDALLGRMAGDNTIEVTLHHFLGTGDIDKAAERANLSEAEARGLGQRLHARKLELASTRQEVAGQVRTWLASMSADEAMEAVERLRQVDIELARTEDALDNVYDFLRPGAAKQADRRKRQAAIALGVERIQNIRSILLASGIDGIEGRVLATSAQYNPSETEAQGKIVVTLVHKKKAQQ